LEIMPAQYGHADQIAAIYNQALISRTATFETRPRSIDDVKSWIDEGNVFVVAISAAGRVAGFARASLYRERDCYAGIKEYSVYVAENQRGRGVGETVLRALIDQCRADGVWKLLSRIFPENRPSIILAQKVGFEIVGTYKKHGKLEGVWKDCVIVELSL